MAPPAAPANTAAPVKSPRGLSVEVPEPEPEQQAVWHAPNLGKAQSFFVEFVALPMFEVFAHHISYCQSFLDDGRANVQHWIQAKQREVPLLPPTVREVELLNFVPRELQCEFARHAEAPEPATTA